MVEAATAKAPAPPAPLLQEIEKHWRRKNKSRLKFKKNIFEFTAKSGAGVIG